MTSVSEPQRRVGPVLLIAAVVTALAAGLVLLSSDGGRVCRENFERLRTGMSRDEVDSLLGSPDVMRIEMARVDVAPVDRPGRMVTNSSLTPAQQKEHGFAEHLSQTWFSPEISIVGFFDSNDRLVCFYDYDGQSRTLLGRIWLRPTVVWPRVTESPPTNLPADQTAVSKAVGD